MRTLILISIALLLIPTVFVACEKESQVAPVPLTNAQILVQKDWLVDELYRNLAGSNTRFVRNGMNTTGITYENMRFHFNVDGTGTYVDEVRTSHSFNWNFSTPDQKNIVLNITTPIAITYSWNMVELKNNYMHSTSPFQYGMLSARYIQVP
jgi:hypothetical protein